jgi:Protein of unknown function (DUF3800)
VARGLNRKVLCFVDEHGTAGTNSLYLGAVIVLARFCGRVDKSFSDLLNPTANEVHSANLSDAYLKDLMQRFSNTASAEHLVMINRRLTLGEGSAPVLYAQALVETVKIGLRLFRRQVLKQTTIGNVEVILDANHHNTHPDFTSTIADAQQGKGLFRGVKRVVVLDSAASRLLQLADIVAYSRKWTIDADITSAHLAQRYGVHISA